MRWRKGSPEHLWDNSGSYKQLLSCKLSYCWTGNLAEANASEEDKIQAMVIQSHQQYDPINCMKKLLGPPPPSYTCFYCGKRGHYNKELPNRWGKISNFESVPRLKKSTGIPRSFMVEGKDPNAKGAMATKTGKYTIPIINKEKLPFLPEKPSSSSPSCSSDPIPEEPLCCICKEIMTEAVTIPCCGNSYCDECVSPMFVNSELHTCGEQASTLLKEITPYIIWKYFTSF
uniref:RING-type domain-containing protein n=1 Tax=Athene cunicularia TaxID=194338 RepID=A0A663N876_ATHCN